MTVDDLTLKYKELLNIVMQVTDERDRYKASFKEAARELLTLKETVNAKSVLSTPVAKSGSGFAIQEKHKISENMQMGRFSLWHLLVVGIISFLVARLFNAIQQSFQNEVN